MALALVTGVHADPAPVTCATHIVEVPPDEVLRRIDPRTGHAVERCHARCVARGETVSYCDRRWRVVKAGRWGAWLVWSDSVVQRTQEGSTS